MNPNVKENKIILLTILNPVYSLNVDIIHKICRENGQVCIGFFLCVAAMAKNHFFYVFHILL